MPSLRKPQVKPQQKTPWRREEVPGPESPRGGRSLFPPGALGLLRNKIALLSNPPPTKKTWTSDGIGIGISSWGLVRLLLLLLVLLLLLLLPLHRSPFPTPAPPPLGDKWEGTKGRGGGRGNV